MSDQMLKESFQACFQEFIFQRCDFAMEQAREDSEYSKALKKASKLSKRIMDILRKENRKLFLEYDSAEGNLRALEVDYAYKQGLKDGIMLKEELGMTTAEKLVC